jgi:Rrf2 family protein
MFSQTAEHALRALLYLARQPAERLVTADEIARSIGAPANYLAKTLNALTKRRLVSGTRGPRGGFRLEVAPEELPVASVIDAFDEPRERGVCLLGGRPCDDAEPCQAHARWQAMWAESLEPLRSTTLAELLAGEVEVAGLGTIPAAS